jgi:hypothetical protein
MTPSAAAPAAVRRTKRASETGGRCRMAASCDCASPNPIAFLQIRSIRSLAAATFCMSTPTGVAAIQCKRGPAGSSIRSTTSPHRADTVTLTPSALPNRSKPRIIRAWFRHWRTALSWRETETRRRRMRHSPANLYFPAQGLARYSSGQRHPSATDQWRRKA